MRTAKRYAEVIIQSNEKVTYNPPDFFHSGRGNFLSPRLCTRKKTFIHVPIWQNSHMPQKLPVKQIFPVNVNVKSLMNASISDFSHGAHGKSKRINILRNKKIAGLEGMEIEIRLHWNKIRFKVLNRKISAKFCLM